MSPLISIIIPVYKAKNTIRRCVDSILSQSFQDWELLLIDDGSPDDSGCICDEYEYSDSRIKVIHQMNAGPSAARNRGIENANGEWVVFVDADDWVEKDYLGSFVNMINLNPELEIIFCGYVHEKEKEQDVIKLVNNIYEDNNASAICYLHKNNAFGYSWNKIYRLEVINAIQLRYDEMVRLREDELFVISYCGNINKVGIIDSSSYHYVDMPNSLIHAKQDYLKYLMVSDKLYHKYQSLFLNPEYFLWYKCKYFEENFYVLSTMYTGETVVTVGERIRLIDKCKKLLDELCGTTPIKVKNNVVKNYIVLYLLRFYRSEKFDKIIPYII